MQADEFVRFLVTKYRGSSSGRPLSAAAAGDAMSRCKRAERVLDLDLDKALRANSLDAVLEKIAAAEKAFAVAGRARLCVADIKSAVRKYAAFAQRHQPPQLTDRAARRRSNGE